MIDLVLYKKILSLLIYPLGVVISALGLSWCLRVFCRSTSLIRLAAGIRLFALLLLLLTSNPMFADWLASTLEKRYPPVAVSSTAEHDAIIVLGGGLSIPQKPALHAQLTSGSDRYWHATGLYRSGLAPVILIAGGNVFQQFDRQEKPLLGEASYAKGLLTDWGVPESAIVIEESSRTTSQNMRNIGKVIDDLGLDSALLVTSALHMPRSMMEFERLPVNITPSSADVLVRDSHSPIVLRLLPSAGALSLSTRAIHEYYGLFVLWLTRQ